MRGPHSPISSLTWCATGPGLAATEQAGHQQQQREEWNGVVGHRGSLSLGRCLDWQRKSVRVEDEEKKRVKLWGKCVRESLSLSSGTSCNEFCPHPLFDHSCAPPSPPPCPVHDFARYLSPCRVTRYPHTHHSNTPLTLQVFLPPKSHSKWSLSLSQIFEDDIAHTLSLTLTHSLTSMITIGWNKAVRMLRWFRLKRSRQGCQPVTSSLSGDSVCHSRSVTC